MPAARKPELRPHAERGFVIAVSRRRSPLPRDFHLEIPRRVPPCPKAQRPVLEGWRRPFAWSLLALLSRFVAFDDALGHAARSRIPFDLAPRMHSRQGMNHSMMRSGEGANQESPTRPREWPREARDAWGTKRFR